MTRNNLINKIKEVFGQSNNKEWLDELVRNLEAHQQENSTLPFKIVDTKSKGFIVKICGLYAFAPFSHMPWKYNCMEYWTVIASRLIGKVFYGTIYQIKKNPLSITVNGEASPLEDPELTIGIEYDGVVLRKTSYGAFIDIGYHFDWKCGSLIGLVHWSGFNSRQAYSDCSEGDDIRIIYQGADRKGRHLFSQSNMAADMYGERKPEPVVGQEYNGVIFKKTNHGVHIDISSHFGEGYSTLIGFLPRSMFRTGKPFLKCSEGDEIAVVYQGMDEKGRHVYRQNSGREPELIVGEVYRGVIIKKLDFGLLVDIGCHFNWECRSLVGFLSWKKLASIQTYLNCSEGDEIEVVYEGTTEDGRFVYGQGHGTTAGSNERFPELTIGKAYTATIIRKVKKTAFMDISSSFGEGHRPVIVMLSRSDFNSRLSFAEYSAGDEIQIVYMGLDGKKRPIYKQSNGEDAQLMIEEERVDISPDFDGLQK